MSVKKYFETYAERFDGFYKKSKLNFFQKIVHNTLRKPGLICRFKITTQILGNVENKRILDVGCGSGVYSIYFSKMGANVIGLDFSSTMISLSRKNAEFEQSNCQFILKNFLEYKPIHNFDTLLFIGVFDYIRKRERFKYFEKVTDVISEDIIATFPKLFNHQSPIRYLWLLQQNCPVYFYTRKSIGKLANNFNLHPYFYDCGPIWVVDFKKRNNL